MTSGLPLALPAVLFVAPMLAASFLPDPVRSYPALLALLAPATLGWLLAARRALVAPPLPDRALLPILAVAIVARVAWLAPAAPLSDDLYRYLWDGRVANAGIHPFAHAPSADELAPLRDDEIWPRINHPEIPTIYPPVAQELFRAIDRLAPTPAGVRATAVLLDLATVVLLALLLRAQGRGAAAAVAVGWCPLSVLETAGGGHVDAAGAALLMAGLLAWHGGAKRRGTAGGVLLGLAAMVKPVPVLLLPALLRDGTRAKGAAFVAGAVAAALVAVPYLGAGAKLFHGLAAYAERWRFNDALYWLLTGGGLSPRSARVVLALALVATAFALPRRLRDPLAVAGCVIAAGLALSPTVHPWYALWLVPLLPFVPRAAAPSLFALVALLPVSYAAAWSEATTGTWSEPGWMRPVIWLPPAVLLGLAAARRGRLTPGSAPPGRSSRGS